MARQKTDKVLKRNKPIMVRFTEMEHEVIIENAKAAGIPPASYVRRLALNGRIDLHYHITLGGEYIKPILVELGKIGSNLNQIARFLNSGGSLTDNLKHDIHLCIEELRQARQELTSSLEHH
ncbi:MAG: plasmid mobilization relaxosome protein MobC [Lachnospiraceae bacterium]|nr:plasmid mobilization relaxosome protein MobC [Lachnospiraceae bacterium]